MPKGKKSTASKKVRGPRRPQAEVQGILDKVAALRAQGKSITAALQEVKVPYTNYNYWMKKHRGGASGSTGAKAKASASGARSGKAVEMESVLAEIQRLRAAGHSLEKAIKAKGLTVSNYYYWVKRLLKGAVSGGAATASKFSDHGGDAVHILDQMRKNREERERVQRQVQLLDNDFKALLRKLESV